LLDGLAAAGIERHFAELELVAAFPRHPEIVVGERILPGIIADGANSARNQIVAAELWILAAVFPHEALHAQQGELLGLPVGEALARLARFVRVEWGHIDLEHPVGRRRSLHAADEQHLVLSRAAERRRAFAE